MKLQWIVTVWLSSFEDLSGNCRSLLGDGTKAGGVTPPADLPENARCLCFHLGQQRRVSGPRDLSLHLPWSVVTLGVCRGAWAPEAAPRDLHSQLL